MFPIICLPSCVCSLLCDGSCPASLAGCPFICLLSFVFYCLTLCHGWCPASWFGRPVIQCFIICLPSSVCSILCQGCCPGSWAGCRSICLPLFVSHHLSASLFAFSFSLFQLSPIVSHGVLLPPIRFQVHCTLVGSGIVGNFCPLSPMKLVLKLLEACLPLAPSWGPWNCPMSPNGFRVCWNLVAHRLPIGSGFVGSLSSTVSGP